MDEEEWMDGVHGDEDSCVMERILNGNEEDSLRNLCWYFVMFLLAVM